MRVLYLLSVWIHIVSATLWLGGMLFLVLAMVPVLRKITDRTQYLALIHDVGVRFRWLGWISFGTLFLTGILNLLCRGYSLAEIFQGQVFRGSWGHTLAIKLVLFLGVLLLSILHDFVIGPRATRLGSTRLNRMARWIGRINLFLGLLIVYLAVVLVRGGF